MFSNRLHFINADNTDKRIFHIDYEPFYDDGQPFRLREISAHNFQQFDTIDKLMSELVRLKLESWRVELVIDKNHQTYHIGSFLLDVIDSIILPLHYDPNRTTFVIEYDSRIKHINWKYNQHERAYGSMKPVINITYKV